MKRRGGHQHGPRFVGGAIGAAGLMGPAVALAMGFGPLGLSQTKAAWLDDPGAAGSNSWQLRLQVVRPYLESDLRETVARVQVTPVAGLGTALGVDVERSAVHQHLRLALAAQVRRAHSTWGGTIEQHQWSFGASVVRRVWRGRLGWGATWPDVMQLSLQLQVEPGMSPRPTIEANTALSWITPWTVLFQEQRRAGVPPLRRVGVQWRQGILVVHGAAEWTTATVSLGIVLQGRTAAWEAGVRAHPQLGAGRCWGVALSR